MCSRYNLVSAPEAVRAWFGLAAIEDFPPRPDIRPTEPVAIVRNAPSGRRELRLVRWGLIPAWTKDPSRISLFNARVETAAEKPSFRGSFRHRRCLLPADGFYEWTGPPRARQPVLFRPRGGGLLALGGLHEHWLGADGSEIETTAILTVPANTTVAPVHDRMPLLLPREAFGCWLDCRSGDQHVVEDLLVPAPDDLLEALPVDPAPGRRRPDIPDLLDGITPLPR
ncbi:MAG: SOS response-associated peptidase [Hyphomicrobiaceae bacterium]